MDGTAEDRVQLRFITVLQPPAIGPYAVPVESSA
jgi:hypothetical protein